MSAPGKLVRSSRWKTGPSKGQRPLGSECCVATGDSGDEAYTAIAWGVGLSHERSDIAGAEGFHSLEGNMCGTAMRGADALPGSKATSRAKGSHRKLGDLGSGHRCRVGCRVRWSRAVRREAEEWRDRPRALVLPAAVIAVVPLASPQRRPGTARLPFSSSGRRVQ